MVSINIRMGGTCVCSASVFGFNLVYLHIVVSIGFENSQYNLTEGMGSFEVNIVKNGVSETNVTVSFTTEGRTAGGKNSYV